MNIPRPDPLPSQGVTALDGHIEALLRLIHSRNLALSDLSEVGKHADRPLTDVERLLTSVGDDAHEITLAIEAIILALRVQSEALSANSYRRRTRLGSILLLMIPMLFIGLLLGATYGIDEGRSRERHAKDHPPLLVVDTEALKAR